MGKPPEACVTWEVYDRLEELLYGDDPLHRLLDGNLDVEDACIIAGRDSLLSDILTEAPGSGVGGLGAVHLTIAGDGEEVVLGGDLDVGATEARHLHCDGVALVGLVDLGSGAHQRSRLRVAAIAPLIEERVEESVEAVVGIAGREAEHVVSLLVSG